MKAVRRSSRFFRFSFAGWRRRFVAVMVLCLWLVLSLGSVAQEPKLTPEEWRINGILAALNDDQKLIQKDAVYRLMQYTSEELKANSTNSDLSKILEKKIIELGILDNNSYDLESIRRITNEIKIEADSSYIRNVPLNAEIIFNFRRILRRFLYSENGKPINITKADLDAVIIILGQLVSQFDELKNVIDSEIAIRLNNSSISEYDRSLKG